MPTREQLICSKCGTPIDEDPMLGDRQGGRINIVLGARTLKLVLCTKDLAPIFDLYEPYADEHVPSGTAVGVELLRYLPRREKEDPVKPPSFSGEG